MGNGIKHSIFLVMLSAASLLVKAQDTTELFPPVFDAPDSSPDEGSSGTSFSFKDAPREVHVDTREVPGAEVKQEKSSDDYWYADKTPQRKQARARENPGIEKAKRKPHDPVLFNAPWWRVLFWFLLVGFVILLIWFLATNNVNLFRRTNAVPEEDKEEDVHEDIFAIHFEHEIESAIQQKNFRLAVRLMYLRTLRDLSNRNLIQYTHEKTNGDYLMQLAGTSYYRNFLTLTRSFDYTWYGHFDLSPERFALVQRDFSSFKQQLG